MVLPANWPAVSAFLRVQSQFDAGGFRYSDVEAGLRMAGITMTPALFEALREMEFAALGALRKVRAATRPA